MAFSDRDLIARLIQCEAEGEGEIGMKAVATIIMNRVNSSTRRICTYFTGRKYKKYNISNRAIRLCNRNNKESI